jgi:hypothetical protein
VVWILYHLPLGSITIGWTPSLCTRWNIEASIRTRIAISMFNFSNQDGLRGHSSSSKRHVLILNEDSVRSRENSQDRLF